DDDEKAMLRSALQEIQRLRSIVEGPAESANQFQTPPSKATQLSPLARATQEKAATVPKVIARTDMYEEVDSTQELSNGAVKMRLRRMCEVKKGTARCNVDNETHEQWKRGGAGREELEMALIQSLRNVGNVLDTRKVQEEFRNQVLYIREKSKTKELEKKGAWYTEERMTTSLKMSAPLICNNFTDVFENGRGCALTRAWKYDTSGKTKEYFVETEEKVSHVERDKETIKESQGLKDAPMTANPVKRAQLGNLELPAAVEETPPQAGDRQALSAQARRDT
ncbi:unnamed protein product, partial [Effrenium voratum]